MSAPLRSTGDLLAVVAWTALAGGAMLAGLATGALGLLLTVPLVVLLPGYALVAALFPEEHGTDTPGADGATSLTGIERGALSVVLSVVLVPMAAFVVNYGSALVLRPLVLAVCGLTMGLALVGLLRRLVLPAERRHGVAPGRWLDRASAAFLTVSQRNLRRAPPLNPSTSGQQLLNVFFVVSLLTLAGTVGFAAVSPPGDDEPFTEFYLLTQTGDGEFVAEDLPREFSAGERRGVYVAIGNHEGRPIRYTVVMQLEGEELDRFSTRLGPGRTERVRATIAPRQTGDRLRLSFLLYRGDVPDNPTPGNAYRETHLWIAVGGA